MDLSSIRTGNGLFKMSIQESSFTKVSVKVLLASSTLVQNNDLPGDRVEAIATPGVTGLCSPCGGPGNFRYSSGDIISRK